MSKIVFFDTETTGLRAEYGDRIIELGGVACDQSLNIVGEYRHLLDPDGREISAEGTKIHKLTIQDLQGKPKFSDIVDEFLEFIADSKLLMHNAKFDVDMINAELERCNKNKLQHYVHSIVDTLSLKNQWQVPISSNSLDALCKHFNIDLGVRIKEGHSAVLDSKLLLQVYKEMRHQPSALDFANANNLQSIVKEHFSEVAVNVSAEELEQHNAYLAKLQETEDTQEKNEIPETKGIEKTK